MSTLNASNNKSSSIFPNLVNVTINPYEGKRPRNPERKYNIKNIFESFKNLPITIKSNNNLINKFVIESVYVCKPGGRGCIGKERHGTYLTNRQIALRNASGLYYHPKHKEEKDKNDPKIYGFVVISAKIHWKDNTINNLSVPVEPSGLIGLRMGFSKQAVLKPTSKNPTKDLKEMIIEIENVFLKLLKIKKERDYRIENINCNFSIYTTMKKEPQHRTDPRPKIQNYTESIKLIYEDFKEIYKKPLKPYLIAQGTPSLQKAIFKSKEKGEPTFSITQYGVVEIQGLKSFEKAIVVYNNILKSFKKHRNQIKIRFPVKVELKRPYKSKKIMSVPKIKNMNIRLNNEFLLIDGKPCITYPKPFLKELAKVHGVATKGKKPIICERIASIL